MSEISDRAEAAETAETAGMTAIRQVTQSELGNAALQAQLCDLLRDAVEGGASVGYVLPVAEPLLEQYWQGVFADAQHDSLILLVAEHAGQIVGSAQLSLSMKPNGMHRAEVQKVLVHRAARRRGLGGELMRAIERVAMERGRTLLVLDTETNSGGQQLYATLGYQAAGVIPNFALATIPGQASTHVPTTYMYKLL